MNSTDYLRLSEHKIFKNVRETLPKTLKNSSNLLTIKDGVLFTWDFANNCVLTLNIKAARSRDGDNVTHQVSRKNRFFCTVLRSFVLLHGLNREIAAKFQWKKKWHNLTYQRGVAAIWTAFHTNQSKKLLFCIVLRSFVV